MYQNSCYRSKYTKFLNSELGSISRTELQNNMFLILRASNPECEHYKAIIQGIPVYLNPF